jgi:hypothetical protein
MALVAFNGASPRSAIVPLRTQSTKKIMMEHRGIAVDDFRNAGPIAFFAPRKVTMICAASMGCAPRGRIDIDALRRDRDQLWAEAIFRYRRGDPWWLETEALERLAEAEQQARIVAVDPWLPAIRDWLGDRTDVAIGEVLEHGLGLPSDQHSDNGWRDGVVKRVAKILTDHLGFIKYRPRTPEGRQYRYYRACQRSKSPAPDHLDHPDRGPLIKSQTEAPR